LTLDFLENSTKLNYIINKIEHSENYNCNNIIEHINNKKSKIINNNKNIFLNSRWQGNYWIRPLNIGPKIVVGMQLLNIYNRTLSLPFFEFDWHPAREPFDIPIPEVPS
jgi:hypothetical protein